MVYASAESIAFWHQALGVFNREKELINIASEFPWLRKGPDKTVELPAGTGACNRWFCWRVSDTESKMGDQT